MLSPASQVLIRNEHLFSEGRWLLVNPTDGFIFQQLSNPNICGFHQFYDVYQQTGEGDKQYFGAAYQAQEAFDGAVIYMPKAKEHAQMLIANAAACLKPGALLMLVGENKGGVRSAPKLLEAYGNGTNKLDSARHCSLFATQLKDQSFSFNLKKWEKQLTFTVNNVALTICSLPGVFSHGELDSGTQMLLDNVTQVPNGRILDFASGAGVIGCYLAKRNPSIRLLMTDVSALALHCSKQSAELNGLAADRTEVIPSNGLGNVTGKFNAVYTNPPFHTGLKTDYSVTSGFIQQLASMLQKPASLTLVANQFLSYEPLMQSHIGPTKTLALTNKFALYQADLK